MIPIAYRRIYKSLVIVSREVKGHFLSADRAFPFRVHRKLWMANLWVRCCNLFQREIYDTVPHEYDYPRGHISGNNSPRTDKMY